MNDFSAILPFSPFFSILYHSISMSLFSALLFLWFCCWSHQSRFIISCTWYLFIHIQFFFVFYSGAAHNMTSFYKFVFVCQSVKPRFSIHFISLSMRLHTLFLSPSLCLCILYISTSLYICPHYITSTTFISMQRALVKYYRHVHYFNIRFTGMCTSGIILYAYIW